MLPLVNLSQDPSNDYFSDGLTGEIIRNISIIDGLAVRSQMSSFAFKGTPQNVRNAGKQLNVEYVLEGSVLGAGQQLRINAQLVRVRDDFPLWSGKYDREATDIFAIQDETSRGIVNSLRLKLGRGRRRYETSTEAYDLYLHGRAFEARPALSGMSEAIPLFEETIAKDSSFAPAYAGLAAAYAALSGFDRFDEAERSEQRSKMRAAAEKAMHLDPLLPEAHAALGLAYARDGQWEQSEKTFRHATELDPNSSSARKFRCLAASLLLPLNRTAEALAQVQLAAKSDPLSARVQLSLAQELFTNGRFGKQSHIVKSGVSRVSYFWERLSKPFRFLKPDSMVTFPDWVRENSAAPMRATGGETMRRESQRFNGARSSKPDLRGSGRQGPGVRSAGACDSLRSVGISHIRNSLLFAAIRD